MMRMTRVTEHRGGKTLHFTRHLTEKSLSASRKNVKTARKEWMRESHLTRQKEMPSHTFRGLSQEWVKTELHREGKRYVPVGGYAWLDVGRKGHHYVLAKKTKFGWDKEAYVNKPFLQKLVGKAREKWMNMTYKERARAMPSRKGRSGYERVPVTEHKFGHLVRTHEWVRK